MVAICKFLTNVYRLAHIPPSALKKHEKGAEKVCCRIGEKSADFLQRMISFALMRMLKISTFNIITILMPDNYDYRSTKRD